MVGPWWFERFLLCGGSGWPANEPGDNLTKREYVNRATQAIMAPPRPRCPTNPPPHSQADRYTFRIRSVGTIDGQGADGK